MSIEEIRDSAYQGAVTVESVSQAAEQAREAIAAAEESEHRRLIAHLRRPGLEIFDYVPRRIEIGDKDAARVQGELVRAKLYARTVPEASAFVSERWR